MSKINDALNDAQKFKKANQAGSKALGDVLSLLGDIQKKPEEIIKKRQEEGLAPFDDFGKIRAFDQTYKFESGEQLKGFLNLLESAEKRIEEIRRQAGEYNFRIEPAPKTPDGLQQALSDLSRKLESRLERGRSEKLKAQGEFKNDREKIDKFLKKGLLLFSEGRYEEALQVFRDLAVTTENPAQIERQIQEIRNFQKQIQDVEQELNVVKLAIDREISIAKTQVLKAQETLKTRQELAGRFLHNAKTLYEKNEVDHAIAQWEKAAACVDSGSEFGEKVAFIKEAYKNLSDIRDQLVRDMYPPAHGAYADPAAVRFLDDLHRSTKTEVIGVREALKTYLNLRKGTRRFSPGWSAILVALLFVLGFPLIWFYQLKTQGTVVQRSNEMAASYQAENAALKSEQSDLTKQVAALKSQYRDRLTQLEDQVKMNQEQNKKLAVQAKLLKEDNLAKDKTITQLSSE